MIYFWDGVMMGMLGFSTDVDAMVRFPSIDGFDLKGMLQWLCGDVESHDGVMVHEVVCGSGPNRC